MRLALYVGVGLMVVGCSTASTGLAPTSAPPSTTSTVAVTTSTTSAPTTSTTVPRTTTTHDPFAHPSWLGTRLLELRPDGHGVTQPTPDELVDRRLETLELLPAPADGGWVATITEIPDDVLARSSWIEGCPVAPDGLRYLTMSHWGFDGEVHMGEMIVHADVADDVVEVFRKIFDTGFPIEQMRVIRLDEIDEHPTGDGNVTTSFSCRPAVGSSNWSQHAFGLAIDINPFHNPYLKGDLVIPELASAYTDRANVRPGMVFDGDVVVESFAEIGWSWGGDWNTLKDWMHFSRSGR